MIFANRLTNLLLSDISLKQQYNNTTKLENYIKKLINYTIKSINIVFDNGCHGYRDISQISHLQKYKISDAVKKFPYFNISNYLRSSYKSFMDKNILENLENSNVFMSQHFFKNLKKFAGKAAGPIILLNFLKYYSLETDKLGINKILKTFLKNEEDPIDHVSIIIKHKKLICYYSNIKFTECLLSSFKYC